MFEIVNEHKAVFMLCLFIGLAIALQLMLRKPGFGRPKQLPEWLWKLIIPMRAAIGFNIILYMAIGGFNHFDQKDYLVMLVPLTSLGLGWLIAAFITAISNSSVSAWTIGICFSILHLSNTLPDGNLAEQILHLTVYRKSEKHDPTTVYRILSTALLLVSFFLVAGGLLKQMEGYLRKRRNMKASNRSLIIQFLKIVLYFSVTFLSLTILGVDLTALTVFGGALGVGLGFGLQKITSNFVSGIILLLEKSVEEDDLIELNDGTLGFIRKNCARYTLVETFDSKEIMVPNEDFITNRVTNWTYSSATGRIEVDIGVSYKSDVELARKLILEAAEAHPLCVKDPEPICYLHEYGDSSVNFILHFWISDITIGRFKPRDFVLTHVWHAFKEHGIEIPFPQRDVHMIPPKDPPAVEKG